ncbi:beta-glucosidase F [Penicillium waksmanii]|uniref:beta-glucosidase F n=1 Tax=Penicillium waksmanii TaxID=69791 RepID=UPI002547AF4C|nr:beta-glucosidase F [Penicillium waksmanii]KAJ5982863.1 beta-glucosidase F [Penicillium waksmanii]
MVRTRPLPGGYWASELSKAILNGTVPIDRLNDMVTRIVATWYKFGQNLDYPLPNLSTNTRNKTGPIYPGADHNVIARAVGSGTSNLPYLITPQDTIKNKASNVKFFITDAFPELDTASPCEVAMVLINADSGENYITVQGNPGDRTPAGLQAWHNGDMLVQAAADHFSNIIVVHTVGPILLDEWIDLPSVKGVLFAYLPGQEAGNSLIDVLFGDYSPSGHLPYTIPRSESDYPSTLGL